MRETEKAEWERDTHTHREKEGREKEREIEKGRQWEREKVSEGQKGVRVRENAVSCHSTGGFIAANKNKDKWFQSKFIF